QRRRGSGGTCVRRHGSGGAPAGLLAAQDADGQRQRKIVRSGASYPSCIRSFTGNRPEWRCRIPDFVGVVGISGGRRQRRCVGRFWEEHGAQIAGEGSRGGAQRYHADARSLVFPFRSPWWWCCCWFKWHFPSITNVARRRCCLYGSGSRGFFAADQRCGWWRAASMIWCRLLAVAATR
ncbi:unnamed protein product, partial [Sphacelaria rigidula]